EEPAERPERIRHGPRREIRLVPDGRQRLEGKIRCQFHDGPLASRGTVMPATGGNARTVLGHGNSRLVSAVLDRLVETSTELTAQEAQIARLARDGLSNPEI